MGRCKDDDKKAATNGARAKSTTEQMRVTRDLFDSLAGPACKSWRRAGKTVVTNVGLTKLPCGLATKRTSVMLWQRWRPLLIREWRPKLPQPSSRTGTFWYWPTPRGGSWVLDPPRSAAASMKKRGGTKDYCFAFRVPAVQRHRSAAGSMEPWDGRSSGLAPWPASLRFARAWAFDGRFPFCHRNRRA